MYFFSESKNKILLLLIIRERDGREGCRWWARFAVFDYVVVVVVIVVLRLLLLCQIRFRLGASFDHLHPGDVKS